MDPLGTLVGLIFLVVIGIPLMLAVLTLVFTYMAGVVWFAIAVGAFIVGIPLAVAHRVRYGYWA